jgi:hypothetical protein
MPSQKQIHDFVAQMILLEWPAVLILCGKQHGSRSIRPPFDALRWRTTSDITLSIARTYVRARKLFGIGTQAGTRYIPKPAYCSISACRIDIRARAELCIFVPRNASLAISSVNSVISR